MTIESDPSYPLLLLVWMRSDNEFTGDLSIYQEGVSSDDEYTLRFGEIPNVPEYLTIDIRNITEQFDIQGINWFIDQAFGFFNVSENELDPYYIDVYIRGARIKAVDVGLLTVIIYADNGGNNFSITFFTNATIYTWN
ncbi:MAG: hypothetical protein ACTSW4_04340 [Candidatus Ranarchaeia archaeon]